MPASRTLESVRQRAHTLWSITVLIFAALIGALLLQIIIEPGLYAIRTESGLGDELTVFTKKGLEQALLAGPAIFLVSAVWSATALLRRFAKGQMLTAPNAASLQDLGSSVMCAGGMAIFGTPTLWAWTHDRLGGVRFDFEPEHLALFLLGAAILLAGQIMREAAEAESSGKQ